MDPALEFFLITAVLLVVGVALRRVSQLERECRELRARTSSRAAQDQERDALAAVGTLASEICHMIVSPLTVILGQCELAKGGGSLPQRVATIEEQARRIAAVVERYRGVGQRSRDDVRDIDPLECARSALRSVAALAASRGVTIHEHFDETGPLRANPFLISQALRHMLRAAVEASHSDVGDVTFAIGLLPVKGETTHVAFAVADDGPGVPLAQIPRVFHPTTDGAGGRLGLGYSVVYAIARAMGATLVIDTAPGAGTRATFKVPVERPATIATPPRVEADPAAVPADA